MTELLERAIAQLKTLPSDRRKGDRRNDSSRTRSRSRNIVKSRNAEYLCLEKFAS
jgi:hypothetical protein